MSYTSGSHTVFFSIGITSSGSRSIATRCWKVRCGSGYERLSGKCAKSWRKDRIRRFVARTCPYIRGNPAASCRQRIRAARQGTVIPPGADGVPRPAQALLGAAFLGSGLLLHRQRQHHGRCHTSVSSGARTYPRQPVVIQCPYYDKCRDIGDDHRPAYDENTNQSAMPQANAVCVITESAGVSRVR